MSKKAKVGVAFITFIVILTVIVLFRISPGTRLTNDFIGTYGSSKGPDSCYISIVPQDNDSFYFMDQSNHIYLKGTYKKHCNDIYIFTCDHANAQEILKSQKVKYRVQSFSLVINGYEMTFKKTSDTPTIIGDLNQYK